METDLLFGRNEKERNERRLRLLITLRSYKILFTGLGSWFENKVG